MEPGDYSDLGQTVMKFIAIAVSVMLIATGIIGRGLNAQSQITFIRFKSNYLGAMKHHSSMYLYNLAEKDKYKESNFYPLLLSSQTSRSGPNYPIHFGTITKHHYPTTFSQVKVSI